MADDRGTCPVVEFDYFAGNRAPLSGFREFDGLAQRHRPVVRTEQGQGYYVLTDYETILEGMQNPGVFSSGASIPTEPDPVMKMIPLHLDPPVHTRWRQVLGQYFSPGRTAKLEPTMRQRSRELIEAFAANGSCDFLTDFARLYPTSIFLEILGLPVAELDKFMAWEDAILHGTSESDPDRSKMAQASMEVAQYFHQLLESRAGDAAQQGDDLVSQSLTWQIDGAAPSRDELVSCLFLLLIAGLDTVANQLAYSFLHLATHESDRRLVAGDAGAIPPAVEEMLRAFPIVAPSRKVMSDATIGGFPVRKGDMIVFPLTAAGRDAKVYENADTVDLNRGVSRHLSFGAGPHRCLGSHLARAEMTIALEEWHRLIPDYTVDSEATITEHSGGVYGLDSLPLRWVR